MDIKYIYKELLNSVSKYENKDNCINEINKSLKYIETHLYNFDEFKNSLNNEYIENIINEGIYKEIYNSESNIFELLSILKYVIGGDIYKNYENKIKLKFINLCKDNSKKVINYTNLFSNIYKTQYISYDGKKILYYDNNIWKEDTGSTLIKRIKDLLPQIFEEEKEKIEDEKNILSIDKCIDFVTESNNIEKIKNMCLHNFHVECIKDKLDKKLNLVCFQNKIFNTDTIMFQKGMPHDFISVGSNMYVPNRNEIKEEAFNKCKTFLNQLFPDKEILEYILQWCSTLLIPGNSEKLFHIWLGDGNNGKSAFSNLLKNVFGDLCFTVPSSTFMRSKPNAEAATPHLIRARTSLVGITQEPDGGVLNTGIMKELTGGDNIYIRRLYKESEETYMKTQFIIQTNKTFFVDDTDPAVWSRIRVIKFKSHFIDKNEIDEFIQENPDSYKKDINVFEKNKELNKLIKEISPAFLYIIIDKLKEYKKSNKLPNQDFIKNETNRYKIDMDILQTFIQKALFKEDSNKLKLSEIIKNYNKYIYDNHPNVRKLDKRRLEHVLNKIYGNKTIEEDYLLGYNIKVEYNYDMDNIMNVLNISN
jgi:P4 family phage/plasmid primase-like protien